MDQFFEALEKSKNNVVLNVMEQVQYDETADVLEKGKRAQMGEIREWNGLKYQKTPNGWVLVKEEKKSGSEVAFIKLKNADYSEIPNPNAGLSDQGIPILPGTTEMVAVFNEGQVYSVSGEDLYVTFMYDRRVKY